ncbi:MAG: hypothetical protein KDB53_14430 [Planctomycetes bacterium]|nr:hypothetical protein [Planctomycetota bacterium]
MTRVFVCLLALVGIAPDQQAADLPAHPFDFWIGEWNVLSRIRNGANWVDGGHASRATRRS